MVAITELQIRTTMAHRRQKHANGAPLCDLCHENPASERHHIINKGFTMGNEDARYWANSASLTSLLCRTCHEIADSPESRDEILQRLYLVNGRGDTERGYVFAMNCYALIANAMNTRIPWELPMPRAV